VVDDRGEILGGNRLLAALSVLVARTQPEPVIAISVSTPVRLERVLEAEGAKVVRTRAGTRALMNSTVEGQVTFAGDDQGGFIFPEMHSGFDAPYGLGRLILMLQESGLTLSEVAREIPEFHVAYGQVRVPWESKGAVMRRIAEEGRGQNIDLLDGVKIMDGGKWTLMLPDPVEPLFHVYAESESDEGSRDLVEIYVKKLEALQTQS
jgi:mannose-1-phosphate guanylyltransferase / phosphomannomutase